MTATRPVLIAGAGPVGMTVALGLADRGIPSVVLEKRGARGERETIFNLPPAALQSLAANPSTRPLLDEIAPLSRVEVVNAETQSRQVIEGPDFRTQDIGRAVPAGIEAVLEGARRLGSEPWGSIRIKDFEDGLRRIATERYSDLITLRTGAEVTGVDQDESAGMVRARITSPEGVSDVVEGAFLVAANGSSKLIGDAPELAPTQVHYVGQAARPSEGEAAQNTVYRRRSASGVRHTDLLLENPAGSIVWRQVDEDPRSLPDERVSQLLGEAAANLDAPGALVAGAPVRRVTMQVGRTHRAVDGRVIAVGDANRRPYFLTSTGATTGISVDAPRAVSAIAQALAGADHHKIFAEYDRAVQHANDVFVEQTNRRMDAELDRPTAPAA